MDTTNSTAVTLSTADVPRRERHGWLREVIGREYVRVEIGPPADGALFNEMTIHPWQDLRLSVIRSNAIGIERLPGEPYRADQDAYFAVVLLSGRYSLDQQGREVFLRPGDITLYDATRPHRIHCPRSFSKLIVSIPRGMLRERIAGIEHCTALRIPGTEAMGAVASRFLRASAGQAGRMNSREFSALAGHALDLLTLALTSVRPGNFSLSRSRSHSLYRVKAFVERHLAEPGLNAGTVAKGTGLSSRYINDLFKDEETSLMRHVWRRRLDQCGKDLLDPAHAGHSLSEIAFRWGFNDLSHFSRAFRQRFGCSPREYRQHALGPGRR
ncbi:transcriptional regulator with cupin sensor, AraC family [Methylocaldum marinum]|uniref:Transcriptional regulator with cupin sensor, AraC family n=1 Tax=Methylocaldum marinum TaxID=1432792 RepID=A0A250KY34_9GAMM|nr:helix-turn-helix domain-containing protein [Methylocaldum marinum]BBA36414.1 transcriptional regulator with cupin sensor, AraC family [Methylocaldum marinum]